eukprot:TRINITY_DN8469_c0_g1_i8.p2 TRINITY_DN8469_c0_g1~~TRINITY_DN8469_c0_g1_i8.p2  ORF type:complete len:117 (-),score=19.41 TRINITY_DN8469_c0_g1_i8:136-486(-)
MKYGEQELKATSSVLIEKPNAFESENKERDRNSELMKRIENERVIEEIDFECNKLLVEIKSIKENLKAIDNEVSNDMKKLIDISKQAEQLDIDIENSLQELTNEFCIFTAIITFCI